jgi:hypothetical protein
MFWYGQLTLPQTKYTSPWLIGQNGSRGGNDQRITPGAAKWHLPALGRVSIIDFTLKNNESC